MKQIQTTLVGSGFTNSELGASLRKEYPSIVLPQEPLGRLLTREELAWMFVNFKNHSWTASVDGNGHILLGGGMSSLSRYYITMEDMEDSMRADESPFKKYSPTYFLLIALVFTVFGSIIIHLS